MCEKESELSKEAYERTEYEQISQDWRHRDSMLWQALTVSITLTGAVFVTAFTKDLGSSWVTKSILFFFSALLNYVLLLKITKDHYYQLGSTELLKRIEKARLEGNHLINPNEQESFRLRKPSTEFLEDYKKKKGNRVPHSGMYKWLINRSAFKGFFRIQFTLLIISCFFFMLSISAAVFPWLSWVHCGK